MMPGIRVGTSAFTAAGWVGSFYPEGLKPAAYLNHYAQHFDTVEVDSTYYRTPSASTVKRWYEQTPKNFLFSLKIVQTITHEKVLVDCEEDFREFLAAADLLAEKLGPLLFQFPYFNAGAFPDRDSFLDRLSAFVKQLPQGYRFAVELRNRHWLVPRLLDILREKNVALALIDHPWMPRPREILAESDPITSNFTYIRLLGDRKAIEEKTKSWDKTIENRQRELFEWVEIVRQIQARQVDIFAYANNHYAGHAPATVRQFLEMLEKP
jgi:uncharacterized protein YecE (DUF72 family)